MSDSFNATTLGAPLAATSDVHRLRHIDPNNPNQGDAASQHKQQSRRGPQTRSQVEDSIELSEDAKHAINTHTPDTITGEAEQPPLASPAQERFQTLA